MGTRKQSNEGSGEWGCIYPGLEVVLAHLPPMAVMVKGDVCRGKNADGYHLLDRGSKGQESARCLSSISIFLEDRPQKENGVG